jgi:hypothetical protein
MRIDSAGMPIPDPPDHYNREHDVRRCPSCGVSTWPDIDPSGQVRARHCIACQIRIDIGEGHML